MDNLTVYSCDSNKTYKITGVFSCDKCDVSVDGEAVVKPLEDRQRIEGADGIGRLYRRFKYIKRPEGMCECESFAWLASDVTIVPAD